MVSWFKSPHTWTADSKVSIYIYIYMGSWFKSLHVSLFTKYTLFRHHWHPARWMTSICSSFDRQLSTLLKRKINWSLCMKTSETTYIYVRGCAAKPWAWPTSRCRRTESIVPLEREVCSCAELQVFSCYRGWKEACQATRAISTTSKRELSSSFFYSAMQGAEGNSRHSNRNIRGTCAIVCHRQKLHGPG